MRGLLCVIAIVALVGSDAAANRRDWTGSLACGACHPAELAAWQATPHALTVQRFGAQPAAGAPPGKCLACHGTGEAPAGPAIAVEVGCEACHGAGAAYAEEDVMRDRPVAVALGLIDLSTPKARATLCLTCHARGTRSTPFDPMAPVHALAPSKSP